MLTGEAKRAYQREYMRKKRSNLLDPVRPALDPSVRPNVEPITPREIKQAKLTELRTMVARIRSKPQEQSHEEIPVYNPSLHRAGDKVRVWWNGRYVVKTIPRLDVEGQPIP